MGTAASIPGVAERAATSPAVSGPVTRASALIPADCSSRVAVSSVDWAYTCATVRPNARASTLTDPAVRSA